MYTMFSEYAPYPVLIAVQSFVSCPRVSWTVNCSICANNLVGIAKQHIVDSCLLKVCNSTGVEFIINDNLHCICFLNGK